MNQSAVIICTHPLGLGSTERDPEEMGGENEKNGGSPCKLSVLDKAAKAIQHAEIVFCASDVEATGYPKGRKEPQHLLHGRCKN